MKSNMPITKFSLQESEERIKKEMKDFVVEEDKKLYSKVSQLIHTTAPETKKRIQDLHDHIRVSREEARKDSAEVKRSLESHTEKEENYWKKIDTLVDTVNQNKELLEENIDGIKGVTNLINASKVLKAFVTYVVIPLGTVIATIYAIKEWIIKP
jgi:vacuolar-type H+-ATPase subunit I/STV1